MTSDPTENILLRRDQAIVERRSKRPDRRGGEGRGYIPKRWTCKYSVITLSKDTGRPNVHQAHRNNLR